MKGEEEYSPFKFFIMTKSRNTFSMKPSEHHLTPPPPSKVAARYTLPSLYLIQSVFQSLYLVLFFSTVPYPSQPEPSLH